MEPECLGSIEEENGPENEIIKKQIEGLYQENLRLEQQLEIVGMNEEIEILKQLQLNDEQLDSLTLRCSYITKDILIIDKIRSDTDKRKWLYAYFSK